MTVKFPSLNHYFITKYLDWMENNNMAKEEIQI